MFNFKTDFFEQRPKERQLTSQEQEPLENDTTLSWPGLNEVIEAETFLSKPEEDEQEEVNHCAEPGRDEQIPTEAIVSDEVPVFYHPGRACVESINRRNVQDCENTPVTITGLTTGVTAKIPVVLAELAVQINLASVIKLPEKAMGIKDIGKRVKLTQCLLLLDPGEQIPPVLFLEGFVRKNITYASRGCANDKGICGDIRHCAVDVPFNCTTTVEFITDPILPIINTSAEFEYIRKQALPTRNFAEKDELLSGDFSEFNQATEEFYNELPYCELVSSRIVEYDEFINRTRPCGDLPIEEIEFSVIEQKMVILLTIKVLQKQQVSIPPFSDALLSDFQSQLPEVNNESKFTKNLSEDDTGLIEEDSFPETEVFPSDLHDEETVEPETLFYKEYLPSVADPGVTGPNLNIEEITEMSQEDSTLLTDQETGDTGLLIEETTEIPQEDSTPVTDQETIGVGLSVEEAAGSEGNLPVITELSGWNDEPQDKTEPLRNQCPFKR
ncbi:MAG: CsxC family protein [Bacillota bacterium]